MGSELQNYGSHTSSGYQAIRYQKERSERICNVLSSYPQTLQEGEAREREQNESDGRQKEGGREWTERGRGVLRCGGGGGGRDARVYTHVDRHAGARRLHPLAAVRTSAIGVIEARILE